MLPRFPIYLTVERTNPKQEPCDLVVPVIALLPLGFGPCHLLPQQRLVTFADRNLSERPCLFYHFTTTIMENRMMKS